MPNKLSFCNLPDDIFVTISEFCNMEARCALSCTSRSQFNRKFVGSVKLSKEASHRFLYVENFRLKIQARLLFPAQNIHIQIEVRKLGKGILAALMLVKKFTWVRLKIKDISDCLPLKDLTNLTELDLYNTRVSDISSLSGLTNLRTLELRNTQVSDISCLSGLTNLRI